jgi:hypothetical protein
MIDLTAADDISGDARARSNVLRLAAAQALTGANSAVIFATGSIVGATLAPSISLATVPLSMYVVFFTGALIARFGAPVIVALGLSLEAAGAMIGLSGITAVHFRATLMVLGLGWNFSFVGASALVLETHRPQERNKVQAFNDFLVFGMMAVGSFSSGQLLASYGWSAVNMVMFPPVLLGLAVLAAASFARRRAVSQQVAAFPDPGI